MTKKILYIEDDLTNMILVRRVIQARGYSLLEAFNGQDGLAIVEKQNVDLVLLDVNLPDIDGYEIAGRLRSHNNSKINSIPIIAITANALKGDAEKAIRAGCNLYISKPISIIELIEKVEASVQ
jgi:CheY-like chemotaxis protein